MKRSRQPACSSDAKFDGYRTPLEIFEALLDEGNTSAGVWVESTYRSEAKEATVKMARRRSHMHRKGQKDEPLSEREQ